MVTTPPTERILGIDFWNGTAEAAAEYVSARGGFVVAPSGTCFDRFLEDSDYRLAIVSADIALIDSGLVATLWRIFQGRTVQRVSGLRYLRTLVARPEFQSPGNVFWILPHQRARDWLLEWGQRSGTAIEPENCYVAPMYGRDLHDQTLLDAICAQRPRHIVIGIGAGPQERLGHHLREQLHERLPIHCIGGALAFLTGDQVAIPSWADRLYLGWLFRLVSQPRVFIPRLRKARVLPLMIARYGAELPPMKGAIGK